MSAGSRLHPPFLGSSGSSGVNAHPEQRLQWRRGGGGGMGRSCSHWQLRPPPLHSPWNNGRHGSPPQSKAAHGRGQEGRLAVSGRAAKTSSAFLWHPKGMKGSSRHLRRSREVQGKGAREQHLPWSGLQGAWSLSQAAQGTRPGYILDRMPAQYKVTKLQIRTLTDYRQLERAVSLGARPWTRQQRGGHARQYL